MEWDVLAGRWKQLKGAAKEKWGELTDDDLLEIEGARDKLAGKLQQRYGYAKAEAEKQADDWSARLADDGGVTSDEARDAAAARQAARASGDSGVLSEVVEGWRDMAGSLKEKWGALTDADLDEAEGRADRLAAKLQEKYGYAKEEAERQVEAWTDQARRALKSRRDAG
ncbi:CsbD family protein [Neomegalonema perideroedes]